MKKILLLILLGTNVQAEKDSNNQDTFTSSVRRRPSRRIEGSIEGHQKKPSKPKPPSSTTQQNSQSTPSDDAPINAAEASAILQVAGGFFQILTAPNDPTHLATGIGAMASGMANLFYQLMKSKGLNPELSDQELEDLAEQMADMVNHGVEMEMVRRSNALQ